MCTSFATATASECVSRGVGDQVVHGKFGRGVVIDVRALEDKLEIWFESAGFKTFIHSQFSARPFTDAEQIVRVPREIQRQLGKRWKPIADRIAGTQATLPLADQRPAQKYVFRDGKPYRPLSEVTQELRNWILSETQDWSPVLELTQKATQRFADYSVGGMPFFNQGGFDPNFCVTRKNPGLFIRSGLLVFRRSMPSSPHQWEFKARAAASPQEVADCIAIAEEKGKFILDEAGEVANANHN